MFLRNLKTLQKLRFDLLICDEAQASQLGGGGEEEKHKGKEVVDRSLTFLLAN